MAIPGAVKVNDVWESFRIYHDNPRGLKDRLVGRRRAVAEEFWALRAVSFELEPGETLALIGPNGSGKSTLLKCLAGILVPSLGEVETFGRIAAMLELGAGFHGDLTGRENIYLNASILGFGKKYVAGVFDDIVEFAELADFIDAPIRTYSSGMYLRLGFAVAVHLDPDILMIDEVLAVGDARFVDRCLERIYSLKRAGVTIVLVTHDLASAAALCDRALYLERGEVKVEGISREVIDRYQAAVAESQSGISGRWEGGAVYGTGEMTIGNIHIAGNREGALKPGENFTVCFEATANTEVEDPVFGLIIRGADGTYVYGTNTLWRQLACGRIEAGQVKQVQFDLAANLVPGRYLVTVAASRSDGHRHFDWHTDAAAFDVVGPFVANGFADLFGAITISNEEG